MLTPKERADIRRHLGYGANAINRYPSGTGSLAAYRVNADNYPLELRLDMLDSVSEAMLSGKCLSDILVTGLPTVNGDSIQLTIASEDLDSPEVVEFIASGVLSKYEVAGSLAASINSNLNLKAAGITIAGPYRSDNPQDDPFLSLTAPRPFTVESTFTGRMSIAVLSQGERVDPSATVATSLGTPIIKYGFIPILNFLSGAIAGATRNADLARAGTYVRGRELRERKELLVYWRNELSSFLNIPLGPRGRGM